MSAPPPTLAPASDGRWLTFSVDRERFAVPALAVWEVLFWQAVTAVPTARVWVLGLINLRGQILPAVDLRRRLGVPARQQLAESKLLVVGGERDRYAIAVDDTNEVVELPAESWQDRPEGIWAPHRALVRAVCPTPQHLLLGLDLQALWAESETC